METEIEIRQSISELKSYEAGRRGKYLRNYRMYCNTPRLGLNNIRCPSTVGYFQDDSSPEDDTTATPAINVIKSCIDTLTSRMAATKVRPFFNCVNGTFKDIQICKQSQQYFDQYFDFQGLYKTMPNVFRDSAIFDTGWIYIDEVSKKISRALPWQIYVRPAEMNYDKLTKIYYERMEYPVSLLPEELRNDVKDHIQYCTYGTYYDTVSHTKAEYVDMSNKLYIVEYKPQELPFVFLHYNSPIISNTSMSIVDMLNSIQLEINSLMSKIKDASQLNPANTYFVPADSTIKATQLNNRIGNIVTYATTPSMTGSPVTVATPPFIDNQYMETVDNLVQKAYEMVGVSSLSAQSKKPTGLNSGVALSTMEDLESDRFETQLNQIIRAYVEIAKKCIACFDKSDNILPKSNSHVSIKWRDVAEETDKMVIQFSGADALSKDPSQKLQQLQAMVQAGILPAERMAQYMEIPDVNSGYNLANNSINAVLSVIDDCLKNDNYDVPEYIPFDMLKQEIINTQLSLRASNYDENKEDIDKLDKLYSTVLHKAKKYIATANGDSASATNNVEDDALPKTQSIVEKEAAMDDKVDLDMSTEDK